MSSTPTRGYAKGAAKRVEILRVALEAYASSGRQGPSLRSIAEAVGMTEAGVLHHFASKDHLLVAILEARDDLARETFDFTQREAIVAATAETTKTPGLVKLFVDMSAAAADPQHPAADFMNRHGTRVKEMAHQFLGPDATWEARVMLATAEGLQIQWLRDPSIDVAADLERLVDLFIERRLEAGVQELTAAKAQSSKK